MEEELKGLRHIASAIVGAKRASGNQGELRKLASDGLLQILKLKDENKRLCFQVEESKEETARSRQALEQSDLVLQNLLYEKQYYVKEIMACRAFQSKVKDEAVALMPVEDFFASLTDSAEDQALKEKALSNEHELMKARLVHENRLRKQLVKQMDQLKQMKVTLLNNVGQQERVLKDLQSQLKQLEATSRPLQNVLTPTTPLRGSMSRAAELLPTPLYVVYAQLVAAREALELGCSVSIAGNVDEAESYARANSAAEEEGKQAEEAGSSGKSSDTAKDTAKEDLYKAHPLSLQLDVYKEATLTASSATKPPSVVISVLLQYLPALKVITAHCSNPGDNSLLKGLFPGDDGSGMPLEALAHRQGGAFRYSSSKAERPFRWCQHLGGLDFVPSLPTLAIQLSASDQEAVLSGLDSYRRQQRVHVVVQRLRDAKQGDATLMSLYSNILKSPLPSNMSAYQRTPQCIVVAWEEVTAASAGAPPPTPAAPKTVSGSQQQQAQQQEQQPGGKSREASQAPTNNAASEMMRQLAAGLDDEGELPAEPAQAAGEQAAPMETDGPGDDGELALEGAAANGQGEGEGGEAGAAEGGTARAGSEGPADAGLRPQGHRRGRGAAQRLLLLEEEEAEAVPAARGAAKPPSRLYRMVLRSKALEVEAHVRVFSEYPLRPPLIRVQALRELPPASAALVATAISKGGSAAIKAAALAPAGRQLEGAAVNSIMWLEQQANVDALAAVPAAHRLDTLLYQLTHLRIAFDEVTGQYLNEVQAATLTAAASKGGAQPSAEDAAAVLLGRQRLRGRDRHPVPPVAPL